MRHDAGAHTFFCGSPGRTVAQIKDEHRLRTAIVEHLSGVAGAIPPRLNGLFEDLRSFIRGKTNYRWAEQPAAVPWEVRFRTMIVVAAVILILMVACGFGAALAASFGWWPLSMHGLINVFLARAELFGATLAAEPCDATSPEPSLAVALQPAVPLFGLIFIWLFLRLIELFLSGKASIRAINFSSGVSAAYRGHC